MSTSSSSRAELLRRRLSGTVGTVTPRPAGIVPVARDGDLPLSFAQRRLWVLDRIQPGGTEYLMPLRLRLRGPVDDEALRRALDELVARHEVLRTRYPDRTGEPVQLIDPPGPMPLARHDFRHRDDPLADVAEAVDRAGRTPFDLAVDWPVRAELMRVADEDRVLLLTLHHIASDGWSESVLRSELDALYTAFAAGRPSPLPPLPVQYADFAHWQRSRLTGSELDRQLDHWRSALDGLTPLALPLDRPRGAVRDPAGAFESFTVPAEVVSRLTALGREHGATSYMVFLAAFQVLLGRYARQDDVVVGSPVAGRDRAETQDLVGLFVNTVVLRTDLSGDPTFPELLARVRETALGAFSHQHTPFERLVDVLAPERDPSRNPLFQVCFQYAAADPPAGPGALVAELEPVPWTAAKFDLGLALLARPDGSLAAHLEYATALFDAATIRRLAGHFTRLLAVIGDARLSTLDILSDQERTRLLGEWAGAGETVPADRCLTDVFAEQVRRTPDAIAVTCAGESLTYAELNARANRLAHRLLALGAGRERLVGVSLDRSADLVVALVGVLKSGAGYLPLDPAQPPARRAYILADAGCELVVGEGGVPVDDGGDWPDTDPEPAGDPDTVAYVIHTSGSTGEPKGVPVTHANVARLMRGCAADHDFGPDDVWTMFHSYAFDFSVWEMWGALLFGGRLVVVPYAVSRSPRDLLELLAAERVTVLSQTPTAFRGLLSALTAEDELALRLVVFGGEALDVTELAPWFARFGDRKPLLVNMYGITETTVHVTHRPVTATGEHVRSPIGRPLRDLRVYLLDDGLRLVPDGVPGQVFVSGPGLARGYLGRPAMTADRFGPDPYSPVPGARMYRTGDLARWRPGGDLEFLGRVDDQLSIRGHRVEPGEIEAAIAAHPGVERGVVVAHRSAGETGERLLAYYAAVPGESVGVAELREHLAARLPGHLVPAWYVPMASIPVTANGKVDRAALPDPDLARADAGTTHVAPRTPVEQAMALAWAEVLGTDRVGVHDNFFAAGGDSIRAIQVVGALRANGLPVTVRDLLVHQDIDGLARFVDGAGGSGVDSEDRRVEPFAMIAAADRARLPGDVVDAYPMSLVQAAMVYQMVADADEHPYHNITRYPMADDAPFDLPALRVAAANAGRRHEILRTSFDLTGYAEPMQLVHAQAALEVGYQDLRGLPDAAERIDRFTAEVRRHPLDPARAPLVRLHVHQTADDRWTLSLVECHAVLDGWSHHSLIQELLTEYRSRRDGGEPEPPPRPGVRFADFVALERQALDSAATREFWRERVERFAPAELPPAWAGGDRAHQHLIAFDDLEPGLRALAATAGVPLKSVLFAAHLSVLAAVGGTRRFHTGLVCNGRPETEGGTAVRGMHLNTVPFCADLTGAATWTDLVRDVFAEEVALWPHRRYPLPRMQRDWARGRPLADIAFTYLDFHVLDSTHIESGDVLDVSPNEFGLDVWTFPGVVTINARPDRLSLADGERVAAMYRRVLAAMAADPAGDARAIPLGERETAGLLAVAAGPVTATPDRCLHDLFADQVARTPDAPALRCQDGTGVTYAELNARANQLARHLRSLGVRQESLVGVLLRRGPELVTSLLAVLKAGAAYVPLDPAHPAARLRGLITGTGTEIVLTRPELADVLTGTQATAVDPTVPSEQSTADLGPTATPDSLAYVIHTSGSTGTPKGVLVEHRNVVNYVTWCLSAYRPLGGTGSPLYSAVSFDLPVTSLFPALLTGQPVTITADDGTPGLDGLVDALENGEFGLLKLTPSHLAVLNRALSPDALRRATGRIVAGGEELDRDLVSAWAEHAPDTVVVNEYGPTETTVGCSYLEHPAAGLPPGVLPIGRPIDNTTMRVLDAGGRLVPAGVLGELYVGGAQVARGYADRPDLTAARFVPDPYAATPGARLYRTGDLARLRPDGVLEFAGRVDDQVKIRGHRVELGEVEAALRDQPEVGDVAVRVTETAGGERELVGYLSPARGVTLDTAALAARLAGLLPAHLVPAMFVALDALPLTGNGKVDTAALPDPEPVARQYVGPRSALENVLARALARALGLPRVGVTDSFVELGAHSLTVMKVIVALRTEHDLRLSFRDFYENRTVAELAAVAGASSTDLDSVVWLRRTGNRPPLFCVHPGSAHWFAALAEHLDPDQPVAAFEWPGLSRPCAAPESVEQIAELNLAELRRIAPHGPYRLLGWCGGSQITTEMVRRLRAEGEDVTFVLLDPALDTFERDNMHTIMARFRRAESLLAALAEAEPADVPDLQRQAVEVLEKIVDDGTVSPPEPGDEFWPARVRVWRELLGTRLDYRHRFCAGDLHLLTGDEVADGVHEVAEGVSYHDYTARWAELVGRLRTHRVPGNHLGVLRAPHVAEVARTLAALLEADD